MADQSFPILFIAGASMSAAITASGLIRRLHEEVPGARFTIVTGARAAVLFRQTPGLDEVVAIEADAGAGVWYAFWRKAAGRSWGLIVDLRGANIGRWLRRRKRATWRPTRGQPPVHKVIEAAGLLGLEDDPPAPYLFTDDATEAAADQLLGEGGPILAVAPGASWSGKAWPAERFAQLVAQILAPDGLMPNGRLLMVGSPDDREAGRAVKLATSRQRTIADPGQLEPLLAYACLKRARLFIGNEGAAMQLAAAAGVPTIGLFGPTDDRVWAPWGPDARALRTPRGYEELLAIDPGRNLALCHMLDLSVGAVVAAAKTLLEQTEPVDG